MDYLELAKVALLDHQQRGDQPFPQESSTHSQRPDEIGQTSECIAEMDLEAFAQAGLIVRVFSKVLGQDILFASDNVSNAALANRTLPIYRAAELRKLALFNPSPKTLRTVHEAKSVFGGSISDVLPTSEVGDTPPRTE